MPERSLVLAVLLIVGCHKRPPPPIPSPIPEKPPVAPVQDFFDVPADEVRAREIDPKERCPGWLMSGDGDLLLALDLAIGCEGELEFDLVDRVKSLGVQRTPLKQGWAPGPHVRRPITVLFGYSRRTGKSVLKDLRNLGVKAETVDALAAESGLADRRVGTAGMLVYLSNTAKGGYASDSHGWDLPSPSVPPKGGGYSGYHWGKPKTFPVGQSVELRRWIWDAPGVHVNDEEENGILKIRIVGENKEYGVADYPHPIWFLRMRFTPAKK